MRRARNAWRMGWIGSGLLLAMAVTSGTSRSMHGLSWFGSNPAEGCGHGRMWPRTKFRVPRVTGKPESLPRSPIIFRLSAWPLLLWALIGGQRDPDKLADLAEGPLRAKILELKLGLEAHFTEHHRFLVEHLLRHLDDLERQTDEISQHIAERLRQLLGKKDVRNRC